METQAGFIQTLSQLKESSKHAIIDGEVYALNKLKEYLHVQREVELRLSNIIEAAQVVNKAQLILVCGNVGDGKSHVLSYLNKKILSNNSPITSEVTPDSVSSYN